VPHNRHLLLSMVVDDGGAVASNMLENFPNDLGENPNTVGFRYHAI
jgi:hypothetical protein